MPKNRKLVHIIKQNMAGLVELSKSHRHGSKWHPLCIPYMSTWGPEARAEPHEQWEESPASLHEITVWLNSQIHHWLEAGHHSTENWRFSFQNCFAWQWDLVHTCAFHYSSTDIYGSGFVSWVWRGFCGLVCLFLKARAKICMFTCPVGWEFCQPETKLCFVNNKTFLGGFCDF